MKYLTFFLLVIFTPLLPAQDYDCLLECDAEGCSLEYISDVGVYTDYVKNLSVEQVSTCARDYMLGILSDQWHMMTKVQSPRGFMLKYQDEYYLLKRSSSRFNYAIFKHGVAIFQCDTIQELFYGLKHYTYVDTLHHTND